MTLNIAIKIPYLFQYGILHVEDGLIVTCFDLFAAGAESVSNTLSFALLYTVLHPEVQRMVQNELDDVVGRDRRPNLNDRPRYGMQSQNMLALRKP
jgi:cytochrome P450